MARRNEIDVLAAAGAAVLLGAAGARGQTCLWRYALAAPPTYGFHGRAVYDSALQRVILVDTYGAAEVRLWAWDGAAWTLVSGGGGPAQREYAGVAYDSGRNRLVLFGGHTPSYQYLNDTWEWDGSAWTLRAVAGPSARSDVGMAYDSGRQRTVLFGGYFQPPAQTLTDTWEWDGSAWTQRAGSGPIAAWGVRCQPCYDPVRARTLLLVASVEDQVWEWTGSAWFRNAQDAPFSNASWLVFDPARARMVAGASWGVWEMATPLMEWTLRQPGIVPSGPGAFDVARSRVVLVDDDRTVEYDGAGQLTSPYITSAPVGGVFQSGGIVVLHVGAGGAEPLGYQWRRDGVVLADGGNITGAATATLTISPVRVVDRGNYSVTVSNACASATPGYPASVDVRGDCYANCDGSTATPFLNVLDFNCFLNEFAAGHEYANCDHSYSPPILNVLDFNCFLNFFVAGCSAP